MRVSSHEHEVQPPRRRMLIGSRHLRWLPAPAVFNLDQPAHYVHWHVFQMSVANIVVILLMIVVFVAAILLPFPHGGRQP